jgi:hypothetical protein
MIGFLEASSDGTTYTDILNISQTNITEPVNFVCFSQIPATKIGTLGPYELKE